MVPAKAPWQEASRRPAPELAADLSSGWLSVTLPRQPAFRSIDLQMMTVSIYMDTKCNRQSLEVCQTQVFILSK